MRKINVISRLGIKAAVFGGAFMAAVLVITVVNPGTVHAEGPNKIVSFHSGCMDVENASTADFARVIYLAA